MSSKIRDFAPVATAIVAVVVAVLLCATSVAGLLAALVASVVVTATLIVIVRGTETAIRNRRAVAKATLKRTWRLAKAAVKASAYAVVVGLLMVASAVLTASYVAQAVWTLAGKMPTVGVRTYRGCQVAVRFAYDLAAVLGGVAIVAFALAAVIAKLAADRVAEGVLVFGDAYAALWARKARVTQLAKVAFEASCVAVALAALAVVAYSDPWSLVWVALVAALAFAAWAIAQDDAVKEYRGRQEASRTAVIVAATGQEARREVAS